MTPAEMMAAIRAIFTQADADAPTEPPPVDPSATPPAPVEMPPDKPAWFDAAVAAALAVQQTSTGEALSAATPPAPSTPPPPVPARQSAGPPANPGPAGLTIAQIDAWPAARVLENKDAVLAALERERPGEGLARFVEGGNA